MHDKIKLYENNSIKRLISQDPDYTNQQCLSFSKFGLPVESGKLSLIWIIVYIQINDINEGYVYKKLDTEKIAMQC